MLLTAAKGFSQNFEKIFFGEDYSQYQGCLFKIDEKAPNYAFVSSFSEKASEFASNIGFKAIYPLKINFSETDKDSLLNRVFLLENINDENYKNGEQGWLKYPIFLLRDIENNELIYYKYNFSSAAYFPFLLAKNTELKQPDNRVGENSEKQKPALAENEIVQEKKAVFDQTKAENKANVPIEKKQETSEKSAEISTDKAMKVEKKQASDSKSENTAAPQVNTQKIKQGYSYLAVSDKDMEIKQSTLKNSAIITVVPAGKRFLLRKKGSVYVLSFNDKEGYSKDESFQIIETLDKKTLNKIKYDENIGQYVSDEIVKKGIFNLK